MKSFSRLSLICAGLALLTAGTAAQATTFSLQAVKKNPKCTAPAPKVGLECFTDRQCDTTTNPPSFDGRCGGDITPTTNITDAKVGDKYVAEVFVSNWSPANEKARAWQVMLDMRSFFSGSAGSIVPVGWNRPPSIIACTQSSDCPPEWPVCYSNGGYCAGPGHDPEKSVVVDQYRLTPVPYIFSGLVQIGPALDYAQYRFGATLLNPVDGPVYASPPKYCGTLALEVRTGAAGTFTIAINNESPSPLTWNTFVRDFNNENVLPLVTETLAIKVGVPACSKLESSNPKHKALDARQPSLPNGTQKAGWNSIELTFDAACVASTLTAADFTIEETGPNDPVVIMNLTPAGNKLTLTFDRRITIQQWTCVKFNRDASATAWACIGHMPADVNNDRTSSAGDILKIIDNLNGVVVPPYPPYQCDIDRSNVCNPADILRQIDLLNGADAYDPWLGKNIVPCPH